MTYTLSFSQPLSRFLPATLIGFVALAGGAAQAHPAFASAGTHSHARIYPCVAGLPTSTICERALGVAVVPPRGWRLAPPGQYTPGSLDFTLQGRIRFSVQPLGAVDSRHQLCAAGAAAAALTSLRFIQRFRPFPNATPPAPAVVAAANTCAATTATTTATSRVALSVQTSATTSAILVRITGRGFRPDGAVSLRAAWSGIPARGQSPRYTRYTVVQATQASPLGAISATLSIPVPARAYASYTVRVEARSDRTLRVAAAK